MPPTGSSRLTTIAARQRHTRVLDAMFLAFVGLGTFLHFSSIATAAAAALPVIAR